MGTFSSHWIRQIAEAAAGEGLNRDALLTGAGVQPDREPDLYWMVTDAAHYALWETIMDELDDADGFPIRFARRVSVDNYGALGLAEKTALSARQALERRIRYLVVLSPTSNYSLREGCDSGYLILGREGERRLGMRCANEAALAEVLGMLRQITGEHITPRSVWFKHRQPSNVRDHAEYFGCELRFGQEVDGIEFTKTSLETPVQKADNGLSRFLLAQLDLQLEAVSQHAPIEREIKQAIGDALSGGVPKMEEVARHIGMSGRTLHRRLAESQLTFTDLVDETRQQLAESLLARTEHPLAEVAFLVGFSEQSAFQRAFKRWNGDTPGAYRATHS